MNYNNWTGDPTTEVKFFPDLSSKSMIINDIETVQQYRWGVYCTSS